jgi:hypothetical protein
VLGERGGAIRVGQNVAQRAGHLGGRADHHEITAAGAASITTIAYDGENRDCSR